MSVHMLRHLGEVTASLIVIQVRVTDNDLLLRDELHVSADLFQGLLVGGVPGALSQQVVSVLVSSLVRKRIQRDGRVRELGSEVIDRLEDLTAHLTHLVERGQVGKLGILVEVEGVIITLLIGLYTKEENVLKFEKAVTEGDLP